MNNNTYTKKIGFQLFAATVCFFYFFTPSISLAQSIYCGRTNIAGTGAKTWTAPSDITSSVTVQTWGGGGGGGATSGGAYEGGGGGGGAYSSSTIGVSAGTPYN